MTKDVFPVLGRIPLTQVKPADIMALCDKIKARGAPKMALLTRNVIRRMYDFAIARQMADTNPAQALVARFIATEESRTRVLEPWEIGLVLRAIYASDIRRALKLALNLLFITMVRKTELTEAKWAEFNLDEAIWDIPAERMKKDKPHRVYLSHQAMDMLKELLTYAGGSEYVFPSTRGASDRPISSSTLNQAVRALSIDVQHFVPRSQCYKTDYKQRQLGLHSICSTKPPISRPHTNNLHRSLLDHRATCALATHKFRVDTHKETDLTSTRN